MDAQKSAVKCPDGLVIYKYFHFVVLRFEGGGHCDSGKEENHRRQPPPLSDFPLGLKVNKVDISRVVHRLYTSN